MEYVASVDKLEVNQALIIREKERIFAPGFRHLSVGDGVKPREMEERLQRLMDEYAGGVHQFFRMNREKFDCFINSRYKVIEMYTRPYEQIIPGDRLKP